MQHLGAVLLTEQATPAGNPPAGVRALYVKSDGKLYLKDSAGTESAVDTTGGGGSGVTALRVASQITSSVVTYADITGLSATLSVGSWAFDYYIFFSTAITTTGLGLQINGTAATSAFRARIEIATAPATYVSSVVTAKVTPLVGATSSGTTALMATIHGLVTVTGAGTWVPQYASEVAASAVNILPQSYGILTPVP